jgi:uncharacterized membrane protein
MAGEFETLSGDEPLARHIRRHAYDRMIMLSDAVFAIAMTLLALELKPPRQWNGGMRDLLSISGDSLVAYLLGFAIVAVYWVGHRSLFARIRRVDIPLTALALIQLCLVAATPGAAALIARFEAGGAMKVYLILIVAIASVQALLWCYAAFVGRLVDAAIDMRERLLTQAELAIAPIMFLASLPLEFSARYRPDTMPVLIIGLTLSFGAMALLRRRLKAADRRAAEDGAAGEAAAPSS